MEVMRNTMKQILFSCLGTSDPVRGEHDGPMLHILRHYRPESVYLFLTLEIRKLALKDERFEKTLGWINAHWDNYRPAFHYIESDVRDVHDIDALDLPLHETMEQISRDNPDAEILINVTSGTPQVQMILSQMAMDMRYRTKGIQVSNYEKHSGGSQRTNEKAYDIELELECNEDEQPDAENRCIEPEMYAIRREHLRRQITALLDTRNFDAVEKLKDSLPESVRILVMHLAARNRLQAGEARRLAGEVKGLPFPLYAYKTGSRGEYSEVSEYFLMMKNLAATGNCTEFLLHMEPLTIRLQLALLDKLLKDMGYQTADFLSADKGRTYFEPAMLQSVLPDLYRHYAQRLSAIYKEPKRIEINTYLCDDLLSYFSDLPGKPKELVAHYAMLKDLRNQLAHAFCTVTEAEVRAACQVGTASLLKEIEASLICCYPACDPRVFSVYEKSIEYIKSNL